ncbi:MAG: glycine cleavage system protein GcvH [Gammaproteobacteria bacterium]
MSDVPHDLKYSKTHEWVRIEEDGTATIGITDHAQDLLGDVVYVELPELQTTLHPGEECGVIESVKAAADLYSPVTGDVLAVNEELTEKPNLLNEQPYGDGWIFRVRLDNDAVLEDLLAPDEYEDYISEK